VAKSQVEMIAIKLIKIRKRGASITADRLIPKRNINMQKLFPKPHFRQIKIPQTIDMVIVTAIPRIKPVFQNEPHNESVAIVRKR
jgi:hypothetical protein